MKRPRSRRPDFCIWLPACQERIYLELKTTAWGSYDDQYYYQGAVDDIVKLSEESEENQRNGLIALGFSKPNEPIYGRLFEGFKEKISQPVLQKYLYEEIGIECVDLQGMDNLTFYAVIGLWFRKPS